MRLSAFAFVVSANNGDAKASSKLKNAARRLCRGNISCVQTAMVRCRPASAGDLPRIARMLADDPRRATRGSPPLLPDVFAETFAAIDRDPDSEILVAESATSLVAVMQISVIRTLHGGTRALIEVLAVEARALSLGVTRQVVLCAIERARNCGCRMIQLVYDESRADALLFFESMGFVATEVGAYTRID